MSKLSLQFHADRSEITSWVSAWSQEFNLFVAFESFFPEYRARACGVDEIAAIAVSTSRLDRIAMNLTPIDIEAGSTFDFLRANPNLLTVHFGEQSSTDLRETVMSAMTDDGQSLKVWRTIRAKAAASMMTGSIVANPMTGASQPAKGHYFSMGARTLAQQGVRLLASAGWNEYRIDDN